MYEDPRLPPVALSVRQPWAWAIVFAGKDIENRSAAAIRHGMKPGRIAIHAAKGMTRNEYEDALDFMTEMGVTCPRPEKLIRGGIIGLATVTGIAEESRSPWFMGPRGLVLEDALAIPPIPAQGALGYFRWKPSGQELLPPKPWMEDWGRSTAQRPPPPDQPAPMPLFKGM